VDESDAIQLSVRRAFSETADPQGHVPRAATETLLAALLDWSRSDGPGSTVATLVAPPGFGKTHLLRVLESRMHSEAADPAPGGSPCDATRTLYLPYAALSLSDLCDWVHGLLGRPRPFGALADEDETDALKALCELAPVPGRPFHLLIDDADSMPPSTLRGIAQGLAREGSPLRLVLGLTDDSRAARMLAALDPLLPFETRLASPLDAAEIEAYLRARLARAELGVDLLEGLDPVTVARIEALSGGVPRRIHRVVTALLEPERHALARALSIHPRTDAWLGRPLDEE
jgi:hypothetical protein